MSATDACQHETRKKSLSFKEFYSSLPYHNFAGDANQHGVCYLTVATPHILTLEVYVLKYTHNISRTVQMLWNPGVHSMFNPYFDTVNGQLFRVRQLDDYSVIIEMYSMAAETYFIFTLHCISSGFRNFCHSIDLV